MEHEQPKPESGWRWKAAPGQEGGLLYEPGNWGDLLKGAWVARLAGWLLERAGAAGFAYADPFAGAPTYALTPRARANLRSTGDSLLKELCARFTRDDRWPGAAMLVAAVCDGAPSAGLLVGDADDGRRRALAACGRFCLLPPELDGWQALSHPPVRAAELVLVDPYDFLRDWRKQLPAVLALARTSTVLVYIYNRAARNGRRLRDYRDFRNALESGREGAPRYLARVPADAFLPSAHHELLLLPGGDAAAHPGWCQLLRELAAAARRIAAAIERRGVVEWE